MKKRLQLKFLLPLIVILPVLFLINDFYLCDRIDLPINTNNYLLKLDRASATFKLLNRRFWLLEDGDLHPAATHYVYTRFNSDETNLRAEIVLLDLSNNTERLLDDSVSRSYHWPRFYRDGVIYHRGDELWFTPLSGANYTRLFPPETKAP